MYIFIVAVEPWSCTEQCRCHSTSSQQLCTVNSISFILLQASNSFF